MIGKKLTPILNEISYALLEHEAYFETKPNFEGDALFSATKIFSSVLMDKMFDLQDCENMPQKDRENMAFSCGNSIRQLIKTYTGIDMYQETIK